jgi:ribonuclease HI
MVFIDGAYPANGPAAVQASIGVHFGPGLPKNISRIIDTENPMNQLAEITAALEAMHIVRSTVIPERRSLVRASLPGASPDQRRDVSYFRLILGTNSSYLVDCIYEYISDWTLDKQNKVYYNRHRQVIKNSEGFRILYKETKLLFMVGMQVVWYYVPHDFNHEADALANAALSIP